MSEETKIHSLKLQIKKLEKENNALKKHHTFFHTDKPTVKTPDAIKPIFDQATKTVDDYFKGFKANPSNSKIEINNQRYILLRAPSLSNDFFKNIKRLYSGRGEEEAIRIGRNILFDMAHLIGIEDAKSFHTEMKLKDPISKLSAGPVHFAYTGWAFVEILPESRPSPDENFFLKYNHPYSFEADSWIKAKEKTTFPVCCMNAGYSSGWCEQSFGIELTAVEITCKAKGDKECTFIMAPPHKINEYLTKEAQKYKKIRKYDVPLFFERKKIEEKINDSLKEKEILLKEIHHRVKNNLQIISSLLKLQAENSKDKRFLELVTVGRNRILSMSIIHEMLYATSDFSKINLNKYVQLLAEKLKHSYVNSNKNYKIMTDISKDAFFEIDRMIPLGLILNELISNSFKYAFPEKKGTINITFHNNKLTISDNGIGLPKSFKMSDDANFGIELVSLLSDQINSKFKIINAKGSGTCYEFTFGD